MSAALVATALAGAGACTFPSYVEDQNAAAGQGGASAAGGATGGASGSSSGNAGTGAGASSSGEGGGGGEAGGATPDPGIVLGWSDGSLDQLGFALLGSARVLADGVEITNKDVKNTIGGVAYEQQLDLTLEPELEVIVGFRITPGAMNGDGLAIMLHASPDGFTRLGSGGGGLGYGSIAPCVAVELDTAEIAAADLPAPHLGLMPDCNPNTHGPSTTALGGDPSDGGDWTLEARWSGKTGLLEVTLRSEATGRATSLNEPMDLPALVGPKLYAVVTAANGEFSATHFVHSLSLGGGGQPRRTLTNEP